MSAARAVGAVSSLLLHGALLLASLAVVPPQQPRGNVPAQADTDDLDMVLVPSAEGDGNGVACEHDYRGIGVVVGWSGEVAEIVSGGPADRAGLKLGDRFLNSSIFVRDQYPLGQSMVLRIERDGERLDLPVTIGRICYESSAQSIPHLKD